MPKSRYDCIESRVLGRRTRRIRGVLVLRTNEIAHVPENDEECEFKLVPGGLLLSFTLNTRGGLRVVNETIQGRVVSGDSM